MIDEEKGRLNTSREKNEGIPHEDRWATKKAPVRFTSSVALADMPSKIMYRNTGSRRQKGMSTQTPPQSFHMFFRLFNSAMVVTCRELNYGSSLQMDLA